MGKAKILKRVHFNDKDGYSLNPSDIASALHRHQACDWGLVSKSEWLANDEAFKSGGGTISRHMDEKGNLFSIAGIAGKLNIKLLPAEKRRAG